MILIPRCLSRGIVLRGLAIIIIFGLISHVESRAYVIEPLEIQNSSFPIWPQEYEGNTIHFRPFEGLVVEKHHNNISGNIVLIRHCKAPYEQKYRLLQSEGAIGVLCGVLGFPTDTPGDEMYDVDGSDRSDIHIPIATVVIKDIDAVLDVKGFLKIRLETESNNYMDALESPWMWVWHFTLLIFLFCNTVLGLYRLYQHLLLGTGCKLTVGLSCVILCLVAIFTMFLSFGIDPLGAHKVYHYSFKRVVFTLPLPLVLAPLFLMALWWHNLLGSLKVQINPGLLRFKWAFYIWITFLIAQQVFFSILEVFFILPTWARFFSPSIYLASSTCLLGYCSLTLYRLQKRVKDIRQRNKGTATTELFWIKVRLGSVILLLLCIYGFFIGFAVGMTRGVTSRIIFYWLFWNVLHVLILIQLLALAPPKRKQTNYADSQFTSRSNPTRTRIFLNTRQPDFEDDSSSKEDSVAKSELDSNLFKTALDGLEPRDSMTSLQRSLSAHSTWKSRKWWSVRAIKKKTSVDCIPQRTKSANNMLTTTV